MLDVRWVELQRQAEQERLDSRKTPEERSTHSTAAVCTNWNLKSLNECLFNTSRNG